MIFLRFLSSSPSTSSLHESHGRLVYSGDINQRVKLIKMFSLSTATIGATLQPVIFSNMADLGNGLTAALVMGSSMLTFPTTFLLHWMTRAYVTKLYLNDQGVFTALTKSIFLRDREWRFTADDVSPEPLLSPFATIKLKNGQPFLLEGQFTDLDAYRSIMRFDEANNPVLHQISPKELESLWPSSATDVNTDDRQHKADCVKLRKFDNKDPQKNAAV